MTLRGSPRSQSTAVSSHGGRRRCGGLHCPALVAGAPGKNSVQTVHGVEALFMARTDGTEAARQWPPMANGAAARVREQSRTERHEGGREGEGNPPLCTRDWIRSVPAWATTTIDGGQRLRALRRERDHHTVTRSVVSGMGKVTGVRG
jgi:hypothetical protein